MSSILTCIFRTMNLKSWHNSDQVHTISILKLDGMEPTREFRLCLGYVTLAQQRREMCSTISRANSDIQRISKVHVLRTCSLQEEYRNRLSHRAIKPAFSLTVT